MNEKDKKATIERYSLRFKEFGHSPITLGWGSKNRANLRFEIFTQTQDFSDLIILDFGCGFGDFFGFLKNKGIKVKKYIGVDINQELITEAMNIYSADSDAMFICGDLISKVDVFEKLHVDYIVSSGVFNHKITNNNEFIQKCFSIFYHLSNIGFSCNFLSDKIDKKYLDSNLHYNPPEKILSYAYSLTNNVVLRNDYMPFEYTVIIDKSKKINSQFTVYEDYIKYVD